MSNLLFYLFSILPEPPLCETSCCGGTGAGGLEPGSRHPQCVPGSPRPTPDPGQDGGWSPLCGAGAGVLQDLFWSHLVEVSQWFKWNQETL